MSRERSVLIRAVRKEPGCQATRLVFADWLEENGELLLAEYIRAEHFLSIFNAGSRPWRSAINQLIEICERSDTPLGGWEYEREIKRLEKYVRPRRAYMLEGEEEDAESYSPVAEPDLLRFEKRHGITLPPEYRAFLLHLANGWWSDGMVNDFCKLDLTRDYDLATPFPATLQDAKEAIGEIRSWTERNHEGMPRTSLWPDDGCLHVADFGCANGAMFVVRGELRGQVWSYCEVSGPFLNAKAKRVLNFFEWFDLMVHM